MSLPKYPAYKYSGLNWLEVMPAHWKSARFSRVISAIKDGTHGTFERVDAGIPLLSAKNVLNGFLDVSESESLISEGDAKSITSNGFPLAGDLLLTIVGTIGRSCVYTEDSSFPFQRSVCFIRLHRQHCPYFFYYFSQSRFFQEQLIGRSKSSAQAGVYMGDVVATSIVFPPELYEQMRIARFLDHETAHIDTLIEEQQRLIELLKEKRQAFISYTVTKGLDPTVPMKDSRVEWLGEVPAHWTVSPLKFLVEEKVAGPYGASLTKAMYTDSGYRVYGQQQVISDDFSIGDYYISEEKFSEMQRYVVFPGDVLISVMGTIGRVSVVPSGVETGIINPRLVRYKFKQSRINPAFVKTLLMSLRYQSRLREESQGSTMEGLNMVILGDLPLILPPLDTQLSIVDFVKDYDTSFNELVSQAASAVGLLQERRSALISAAVTGKIDVRGWQPPASVRTPELAKEAV